MYLEKQKQPKMWDTGMLKLDKINIKQEEVTSLHN